LFYELFYPNLRLLKNGLLKKIIFILLLTSLIAHVASSQQRLPERFIQVDGFVYDKYLNPVPNVTIYSLNLRVGSTSKQNGIYSIISLPGDTIVFSTVGFRRTLLPVPENITDTHYHMDIYLDYDTIAIKDVLVLPWGSYAEFKKAVLDADVHDAKVENMTDNLIIIQKQLINDMGISPGVALCTYVAPDGRCCLHQGTVAGKQSAQPLCLGQVFQWAEVRSSAKRAKITPLAEPGLFPLKSRALMIIGKDNLLKCFSSSALLITV